MHRLSIFEECQAESNWILIQPGSFPQLVMVAYSRDMDTNAVQMQFSRKEPNKLHRKQRKEELRCQCEMHKLQAQEYTKGMTLFEWWNIFLLVLYKKVSHVFFASAIQLSSTLELCGNPCFPDPWAKLQIPSFIGNCNVFNAFWGI